MRTLTVFVTGIIVGLLIAPDKGSNTRRDLQKFLYALKGGNEPSEEKPVSSDDFINS